jgi:hypothetical protein
MPLTGKSDYYMATWVFPRQADGARISRIIATLRSAESGSAAIAFGIAAAGLPLHNVSPKLKNATL